MKNLKKNYIITCLWTPPKVTNVKFRYFSKLNFHFLSKRAIITSSKKHRRLFFLHILNFNKKKKHSSSFLFFAIGPISQNNDHFLVFIAISQRRNSLVDVPIPRLIRPNGKIQANVMLVEYIYMLVIELSSNFFLCFNHAHDVHERLYIEDQKSLTRNNRIIYPRGIRARHTSMPQKIIACVYRLTKM